MINPVFKNDGISLINVLSINAKFYNTETQKTSRKKVVDTIGGLGLRLLLKNDKKRDYVSNKEIIHYLCPTKNNVW